MAAPISHALVLPDANFADWLRASEAYTRAFPRVVVIRSPAGADLNRFRNVSAVGAPGVWQNNDPVAQIRRQYPAVVLIDLLRAATPTELARLLDVRVRSRDRYGERSNADNHLFNRFTIDWPTDAIAPRIIADFNADLGGGRRHEGIDIHAPAGARIRSGTSGTVTVVQRVPNSLGYGAYVQVATFFGNEMHIITYGFLRNITAKLGQILKPGDVLAELAGPALKLVVQKPGRGLPGYRLPDVLDPTPLIYWDGLRLQATVDGLRVRERPASQATVIGQVYTTDLLEPLEPHGRVLQKVGDIDRWIKVRVPSGREGYTAAWFVNVTQADVVPQPIGVNMTGINLDIIHPLGKPAANRLGRMGWVRFAYNVSQGRGSTHFAAAERLYRPFIERYARAGYRIILVLTHQTYGETRFNWGSMTSEQWRAFAVDFANVCRDTASRYAAGNLIAAYQIWNEQDTPPAVAQAAVPVPVGEYANLLASAIRAIRGVDSRARIITGGHLGGIDAGVNYARATLAALPAGVRVDGIAMHAYGLGAPGSSARYAPFGAITPVVRAYARLLDQQVWITEWGVLDLPNEPTIEVSRYATAFIRDLKRYVPDKVAAACWYGWADTMHNGYGLVHREDRPKEPLYTQYRDA